MEWRTSGDTTDMGLLKLTTALKRYKPDIVIIELGANDGLRKLPISLIKNNLTAILKKSIDAGAQVLLLATYLPPNQDLEYLNEFNAIYTDIADEYKVAFVPMFLEGVGGNDQFMQNDGLHPKENAQPIILNNIWPALNNLIKNDPMRIK